jgi:adenylosuccinate lyase
MSPAELEAEAMAFLDLPAFSIASQTYPGRQDLTLLNVLSGLAETLHK